MIVNFTAYKFNKNIHKLVQTLTLIKKIIFLKLYIYIYIVYKHFSLVLMCNRKEGFQNLCSTSMNHK